MARPLALTPKQEKFCQEYLKSGNATQAYKKSYSTENSTDKSINEQASILMSDRKISERIKHLASKLEQKNAITVARIADEYRKLAFLDIRRAFTENGDLIGIQDLDDDTAAAIAGIDFEEVFEGRGDDRSHVGRIHKIKLADKIRALDALAKWKSMFIEKIELTGDLGSKLLAARKRAK